MKLFLANEAEGQSEYEKKLEIDNVTLWFKNGSQFNPKLHIIKGRYQFDENIKPLELISLLNEKRHEWDPNLLCQEVITQINSELSVIYYAVKAPVFFMQSRDFAEKRIRFFSEGTYYAYSSSIPNEEFPAGEKHLRCENVFSGVVLKKEANKLVYYTISQIDYKVSDEYIVDRFLESHQQ